MGHAGLLGFMNVSIGLLVMGFAVLLLMVQFELGPLGDLTTGRKWLMTLILGSGMVAFSIKLVIIATLLNYRSRPSGRTSPCTRRRHLPHGKIRTTQSP